MTKNYIDGKSLALGTNLELIMYILYSSALYNRNVMENVTYKSKNSFEFYISDFKYIILLCNQYIPNE